MDTSDAHTDHVRSSARAALSREPIWAAFVQNIRNIVHHDLKRLKNDKTLVGDAWEHFCVKFLRLRGFEAHLLRDVPSETLARLNLGRNDRGIDIVAFDEDDRAFAVQCKFRRRGVVSWREISTFEALCSRSGPWHRQVVMTNAPGVRREGKRLIQDLTFANGTFAAMQRHEWMEIAEIGEGRAVGGDAGSLEEVRDRFLARLEAERA